MPAERRSEALGRFLKIKLDRRREVRHALFIPATNSPAPAIDNRKIEAAAKRAAKNASREAAAAHNARVSAERAAVAAHEARWGVDGYECA